jgi:hypothetical protein
MSERISREELVKIYNIEITFFDELVDYGLLNIQTENDIHYLMYEDLPIWKSLPTGIMILKSIFLVWKLFIIC